MTLIQESQNKTFLMMIEMMKGNRENQPQAQPTGGDDIEKLEKLVDFAENLKGGGGGKRDWKESLVDKLGDIAVPALNLISSIVSLRAQAGGKPIPGMGNVPPHIQQELQQTQGPMSNAVRQAQREVPQVQTNQTQMLISQFGPMIIGNLGKSGSEVADMVTSYVPNGTQIWGMMKNAGVDGVINAAKSVPEFWSQVEATYGEPHLRQWVDEFINYQEVLAGLDEDEEEVTK
jgi:hypothetical protein